MTQHNLVVEQHSESEIEEFINELKEFGYGGVYPLQIVPFLNPDLTLAIARYDDCNTYQEDSYYIDELKKIEVHSQGKLNFSNLQQDYGDNGTVTLTYTLNGKTGKLTFCDRDTYNFVPEAYLQFVKNTCNKVSGTHRYLHYSEDVYLVFCLFPIHVAYELEAIQANVFVSNEGRS